MENSMKVPQKAQNRTTIWSSNSTSDDLSKKLKTLIQKDTYMPMFTAALFTRTRTWKQPVSISEWMNKDVIQI